MQWKPKELELWRIGFSWIGIIMLFIAGIFQSAFLATVACFAVIMANQAAILQRRGDGI